MPSAATIIYKFVWTWSYKEYIASFWLTQKIPAIHKIIQFLQCHMNLRSSMVSDSIKYIHMYIYILDQNQHSSWFSNGRLYMSMRTSLSLFWNCSTLYCRQLYVRASRIGPLYNQTYIEIIVPIEASCMENFFVFNNNILTKPGIY